MTTPDDNVTTPLALLGTRQPPDVRRALATLAALDRQLQSIHDSTTEPMIGQMRLLWWHNELERLDGTPAPAVPLLKDAQERLIGAGVGGARLATLVEPWETLADPGSDAAARTEAVAQRGERLFLLAASVAATAAPGIAAAGAAWALADAATWLGVREEERDRWRTVARARWRDAASRDWPPGARGFMLAADAAVRSTFGLGASLRVAAFLLTGKAMLLGRA